jgi:hypothetical protein
MSQSSRGTLDALASEIGEALGRLGLPTDQMEQAVRDALRPALDRLELVSREELEEQQRLLEDTRRRVDELEARLRGPGEEPGADHLTPDPGDPSGPGVGNEPRK